MSSMRWENVSLSVDSAAYNGPPHGSRAEGFYNVVIRGNTCNNYQLGIGLDITQRALIENNSVYTEVTGDITGIRMRSKNFDPAAHTVSPIDADDFQPDKVAVRNNTVRIVTPNLNTIGIGLDGNVDDDLTGGTYSLDSNAIHFGSGSTSATQCFSTENILAAKFTSRNYNLCHFVGTAGKWDSQYGSLASTQAQGFDLNSISTLPLYAATPALGNNFSLAPSTSSPLKNTGHPTRSSRLAIGNKLRSQADANPDIGAHEFNATTAVPSAPTRISVQ
jgi:hypothetical protein